jgi:hypothetical protein
MFAPNNNGNIPAEGSISGFHSGKYEMTVFRDVAPCNLVNSGRRFCITAVLTAAITKAMTKKVSLKTSSGSII